MKTPHLFGGILLLLVVLSAFNYGRSSNISNNGGKYLIQAVRISQGNPPSHYDRGPVYTIILAGAFSGFGINISVAHWATQLTYFFAILSMFYFVNLLYGRWVASITGVLLAFSPKLFLLSWRIGIDCLMPAFVFLSCIFYIKGGRSHKKLFFLLSGISYALAFLTKETAVFYAGFPLLLIFASSQFRSRESLTGMTIHFGSSLAVISIWVVCILLQHQPFWHIMGAMSPERNLVNKYFGYTSLGSYLYDMFTRGFVVTYRLLLREIVLFRVVVLGISATVISACFPNGKNDRIYLALVIPLLPFISAYGLYQDHMRHIIIAIIMLFPAVGRMIQLLIGFCAKPRPKFARVIAGCLLAGLCVVVITAVGKHKWENVVADRITRRLGLTIIPGGRFNRHIAAVSDWLNRNVPRGSHVCTGGKYDHAVMFFTKLNYAYSCPNKPDSFLITDVIT